MTINFVAAGRGSFYNAPMETVRRAVIDVGTNSVKLLIAEVAGGQVQPVLEESRQTRLGRGFYDTHRLQPAAIAQTAEAVADFARQAREKNSTVIRVIATSAARDAVNAADLVSAIEKASGLKTEIISGAREAEWAFCGVTSDPGLMQTPLLLLDVGGGSTEFIVGHGGQKTFAHSFPLGTVRLMEKFPPADPPTAGELAACRDWLKEFMQVKIWPLLQPSLEQVRQRGVVRLVGTGGTTSILARLENQLTHFDREKIEHTVLSRKRVTEWRQKMWNLPLAARKEIPGMPKQRADVILTGILIYEAVMEHLDFTELRISTRGLRFAAVLG
jgi:exopolyphosphatase / guanosine-5'-triphosphate,3'-diphosphate pyrophosphatase